MKEIRLNNNLVCQVDDEDYDYLSKFRWRARKDCNTWYASRQMRNKEGRSITIQMSREIMSAPKGLQVDHIDRNGLNNQKSNLRIVNNAQNAQNKGKKSTNTSGIPGVCWEESRKRWQVNIMVDGVNKKIGRYKTLEEAKVQRAKAVAKYHPYYKGNCYGS